MTDRFRDDDTADIEILEIVDLEPVEERTPARPTIPRAPAPRPPGDDGARVERRRDTEENATRRLLRDLLPALDALECCVRQRPEAAELERGVRLALRGLWDVFRPYNLERIEGDGVPFDPRVHEAAEVTPSTSVPVNTVLETLRVGYLLGGELVRPALVRVSVEAPRAGGDDDGGDER